MRVRVGGDQGGEEGEDEDGGEHERRGWSSEHTAEVEEVSVFVCFGGAA